MEPARGEEIAVIDGSNVAYAGPGSGPRLENIELVCRKLEALGYRPLVLVDAALRHSIDRSEDYEKLVDGGTIRQAPPGTDADYFILSFAEEFRARVVSNDRFRDLQKSFPVARDGVIRFMIVEGEVVLERRTDRR